MTITVLQKVPFDGLRERGLCAVLYFFDMTISKLQNVPFDGLRERGLGAVLCFRYDNQYTARVPFDGLRERVFCW